MGFERHFVTISAWSPGPPLSTSRSSDGPPIVSQKLYLSQTKVSSDLRTGRPKLSFQRARTQTNSHVSFKPVIMHVRTHVFLMYQFFPYCKRRPILLVLMCHGLNLGRKAWKCVNSQQKILRHRFCGTNNG